MEKTEAAFPVPYDFKAVGLTKRELFAAMALQGLCPQFKCGCSSFAEMAVALGDALIEALNKDPK